MFNDFKKGGSPIKYIIYKISEDGTKVVVDEIGREQDYDVFREKLIAAKDSKGNPRPSYAVYNMEFTLKEGGARSVKSCCLARDHDTHIPTGPSLPI